MQTKHAKQPPPAADAKSIYRVIVLFSNDFSETISWYPTGVERVDIDRSMSLPCLFTWALTPQRMGSPDRVNQVAAAVPKNGSF